MGERLGFRSPNFFGLRRPNGLDSGPTPEKGFAMQGEPGVSTGFRRANSFALRLANGMPSVASARERSECDRVLFGYKMPKTQQSRHSPATFAPQPSPVLEFGELLTSCPNSQLL